MKVVIIGSRNIITADIVIAIWDGASKGTSYVINKCKTLGKEIRVYINDRTP